jgi:DnaJ-class molecular chaperone
MVCRHEQEGDPRKECSDIMASQTCPTCNGRGSFTCNTCNGSGEIEGKAGCTACNGVGWIECTDCKGTGAVDQ